MAVENFPLVLPNDKYHKSNRIFLDLLYGMYIFDIYTSLCLHILIESLSCLFYIGNFLIEGPLMSQVYGKFLEFSVTINS